MFLQSSFTIRPRYILVYIFFLFVVLLILLIGTKTGYRDPKLYYLFGYVTVFVVLWLVVLSRLKICIDSDVITMETIIRKEQIFWKDIKESRLGWEIEGPHGASLNWIFQAFDGRKLEIRLGFYSRKNLMTLSQQVIEKAKNAKISDKIYQMAEGQFPWYLF